MNAIDPQLAELAASEQAPTDLHRRALPPLRWMGLGVIVAFLGLAALWAAAPTLSNPAIAALRGTRLLPIALGSLTIGLAGLAGAAILTSARLRAHDPPYTGIYLPLQLVKGTAPDTVRAAFKQRSRWTKVISRPLFRRTATCVMKQITYNDHSN